MLEEIYLQRREIIDNRIKQAVEEVEKQIIKIENAQFEKNKAFFSILEENYNIKMANIVKKVYLQGLKDGINIILEAKENNLL